MGPGAAASIGTLFVLGYIVCIGAIIVYAFKLVGRFVDAQERVAGALETIAQKLRKEEAR